MKAIKTKFKYNYKINNEKKGIEKHFIIIGNNSIFFNMQNNLITEYSWIAYIVLFYIH